ncbi:hypothetical protein, conserved [Angomonas deanei]|uniref:C3H1-type domain-containing protein n=1 Tax=Angomonas deanei TaxID=59799 RepID=A0A7G2CTV9_9TRYP|nr:hypothetical protein, conserved [Angomonas deanei]
MSVKRPREDEPPVSFSAKYAHAQWYGRARNLILTRSAPSMLYQLKVAQPQPYTVLPHEVLYVLAQPQDFSHRAAPMIAQQSMIDFYKIINNPVMDKHNHKKSVNYYNVQMTEEEIANMNLMHNSTSFLYHANKPQSPTDKTNNNNNNNEIEDYRVAQLRKNNHFIDSDTYARRNRICIYYGNKDGCKRGPNCQFLHVDKDGNPVPRQPEGEKKLSRAEELLLGKAAK